MLNIANLKRILRYLLLLWLIAGCGGSGTTQPDGFIIYDISVQTTTSTAVIGYKTTYASKTTISYGPSGQPMSLSVEDTSSFSYDHSLTLANLTAETAYDYVITAWMEEEQTIVSEARYFTTAPKTQSEPLLTGLTISGVTATSAVVSWFTDEAADSRVYYGLNTSYTDSVVSSVLTTEHQLILTGLQPVTEYSLQAASEDADGYRGYSQNADFTTVQFVFLEMPDTTVSPGSVFYYPISVNEANDLGGMQYLIDYDENYLTALSLVQGPFTSENQPDFFIVQIDTFAGKISNFITWKPIFQGGILLGTGADGSGIVTYIEFRADGAGTAAVDLVADSTIVLDIFSNVLEGALTGGTVTIQ